MTDAAADDEPKSASPPMLAYESVSVERPPVRWMVLIVAAAVLVRLAFSLTRPADAMALANLPDQIEYVLTAESLRDGTGLAFYDAEFDQKLFAYRMPGYPLLVAACGSIRTVRAVQALLDGSCVVAVYWAARRWRGETAGLIAAAFVAFNPYLIYFSSLLLSETMFTAMLTWGVFGLLSARTGPRVGGVLVLLASVYARPSALGLGVVAAGVAMAAGPGIARIVARFGVACVAAGVCLVLLLLPWALRNKAHFGRLIWTTTNTGYTAYDSFNPKADGSSNQASFRKSSDAELDVKPTTLPTGKTAIAFARPFKAWTTERDRGELGRSDRFSAMAWQYAKEHPQRDAELALAKLGRFWSPVPLSADFGGRWIYVIVGGLYAVPLFVLAAVGVWRGGLGNKATLILLLPALYFSVVHSVFVGSLRYRVPCDVPLAVLAAAGAVSFVPSKRVAT